MALSRGSTLSMRQCADILGISLPTMYKLSNRPDFPVIAVSSRRKIVRAESLERWMDEQEKKSMGCMDTDGF
ncbi:helix-turn-helix transcriptional regulator [Butyricicoccus porcorum]|nr:helix-turn-helix domain-containing protein [Butyricicoccus porcorum]